MAEQFTSAQFDAYAAAIRQRESSNNYTLPMSQDPAHPHSYMGAHQLGWDGLRAAGFVDAANNWTAFANSLGIHSTSDFLTSQYAQHAQDVAFERYTEKNFDYITSVLPAVGTVIDGITITLSGLLAGAHLVGQGAVKDF